MKRSLFLVLALILVTTMFPSRWVLSNQLSSPTVGYFPPTFPRDPIEVNVFLEHVLLGQALEPLIEIGSDGGLIPAVASRWDVLEGGKKLRFQIREGILFSDGRRVTARDVEYTLRRHLDSN